MSLVSRLFAAAAALLLTCAAHALDIQPYSAQALSAAQAAGKPVAVQFHANWCPTCRKQEKALKALQADPELKDVLVLVVDYDNAAELKRQMRVRVQSTMIVFRGSEEVTRLAGVTDAMALKAALSEAL
jgi:thiol:disulfide interchange protein